MPSLSIMNCDGLAHAPIADRSRNGSTQPIANDWKPKKKDAK